MNGDSIRSAWYENSYCRSIRFSSAHNFRRWYETFTYHDLILDVSNVYEVQTTSGIYDDGETYEYPVYICYPDATLTIVNAGMSDPTYEEDHQPRPQWGVYDIETDTRVNLADGMEPIVLDETTDAVFNLEASVFVLKFHFYEPQ